MVSHHVKQIAESHYILNDHPLLVVDLKQVRCNYLEFHDNFPTIDVHFALKSLSDREVVKTLAKEGCSFEVASINELQMLGKVLTEAQFKRVFYSNPAKTKKSIMIALISGVRWFAVDSIEEIRKIENVATMIGIRPAEVHLYLRIQAHSHNSVWPLSKKFGAPLEKAAGIITEMVLTDMKLSGFTFHVGSQCLDAEAWGRALLDVDALIDQATILGVITHDVMVNIGGGFPSDVTDHSVTLTDISEHLLDCLGRCINWERISLAAEPGRFLVSSVATLATRVILRTSKDGDNWLYLDAGVFHGMMEPSQGVIGAVSSYEDADEVMFTLAGPSCDSADVLPGTASLPSSIREDDIVYVENSGAYSMAYATGSAEAFVPGFNGFLPPSVYYIYK